MKKSTSALPEILDALTRAARTHKLNDTEWAAGAGLRKETLSRLRHRSSCDFANVDALASVVGARIKGSLRPFVIRTGFGHQQDQPIQQPGS